MSEGIVDIKTIQSIFKHGEAALNGHSDPKVRDIRKRALSGFSNSGFPGRKHESWKYTNIEKILKMGFSPAADFKPGEIAVSAFDSMKINPEAENVLRIVFVDGHFHEALSEIPALPGLVISTLKEEHGMDEPASCFDDGFTDLNTAFAVDGAVIEVEERAVIAIPIEIYNVTTCPGQKMIQPRHRISLARGAQAVVIESFHNLCIGQSFTNSVSTINVSEDALLTYYKIEHPKQPNTFLIDNTIINLKSGSNCSIYTLTLSGAMVRNNLYIKLDGERAEANLFGLYMLGKSDHADNRTIVDHAMPNCYSNELYKGILDGSSKGVFNGMIIVRQDAQKTNAYQNNRNILVSDGASVNTKPQLEIYADDVKCSHGATSSQIEDKELFYLRSRGIGKEKARAMLMYAFAGEIWEGIKTRPVREYIEREVSHALGMENALELT